MAYFEDEEERVQSEVTEYEVARKCPRVLNTFTMAQPTIDRHNRYRQHLLAMEKRFPTNNYSFRFFTTLLGMVVTNASFAYRYFKDERAEFTAQLDRLASKLIHNPKVEPPSPAKTSPGKASATPSPINCPDGDPHNLVPLSGPLKEFQGVE
eukprot:4639370-Prymnesium_polylepis.1